MMIPRKPMPLPTAKDWVYAGIGLIVFMAFMPWLFKGFDIVMRAFLAYCKWVFA